MFLTWYAFDRRIADVVDRTLANWNMVVNVAQRVPAARIASDARIHTERIYALFVARTFAVGVTLWSTSRQWRDWSYNRNCCMIVA